MNWSFYKKLHTAVTAFTTAVLYWKSALTLWSQSKTARAHSRSTCTHRVNYCINKWLPSAVSSDTSEHRLQQELIVKLHYKNSGQDRNRYIQWGHPEAVTILNSENKYQACQNLIQIGIYFFQISNILYLFDIPIHKLRGRWLHWFLPHKDDTLMDYRKMWRERWDLGCLHPSHISLC